MAGASAPGTLSFCVNVIRVALGVLDALRQNRRHSNSNWSYRIRRPKSSETRNKTRNTPNRSLAIPAAAPAMLEKPRSAAANAMVKKKTDQDNMLNLHSIVFVQL